MASGRNPPSPGSLSSLVGEQLTSVIFVQNYLQLDFDRKRLTINEWPSVEISDGIYRFGENGYRDALCSIIASTVSGAHASEEVVIVRFQERQSIRVDLVNTRFPSGDRVIFHDSTNNGWSWW